MNSTLQIQGLQLHVNLGWRDKERQKRQIVLLDLEIEFKLPPIACQTDDLTDTVCYSTLIKTLRDNLSTKHFHLIEHLTHEIYERVKNALGSDAKIKVHLTKHPRIAGLNGVCFSYGDAEE